MSEETLHEPAYPGKEPRHSSTSVLELGEQDADPPRGSEGKAVEKRAELRRDWRNSSFSAK